MNVSLTKRNRKKQAGFSLMEVLIAVAIIAIMAGGATLYLFPELFKAKRDRAKSDIQVIKQAIGIYQMREGKPRASELPKCLEGTQDGGAPVIDPDKFSENGEILDPWNNPYVFRRAQDGTIEILSYGADGEPGGEGDDEDLSSKTMNKGKRKN